MDRVETLSAAWNQLYNTAIGRGLNSARVNDATKIAITDGQTKFRAWAAGPGLTPFASADVTGELEALERAFNGARIMASLDIKEKELPPAIQTGTALAKAAENAAAAAGEVAKSAAKGAGAAVGVAAAIGFGVWLLGRRRR